MHDDDAARLRATCPRALTGGLPLTPRSVLAALAAATPEDLTFDRYGRADWLQAFEADVARELGKEAAVFMPTGTMAQQIALRIACDRRGIPTIALHPTSHLELHESRAYAMLHALRALPLGSASRLMSVDDLDSVADPIGALLIELPQREIGGQLPEWEALVALAQAARLRDAAVHLDGARLWESAPHYGRSHAGICSLFDTVYVSFYKGLGAIGGAMLAGDADFVALARVWQHRHGGRPFTIAATALSARAAFAENLRHMAAYRERARDIARGLAGVRGVAVLPNPPHTNTFHVTFAGDRAELERRAHTFARETGTFAFARLAPAGVPETSKWEFVVGPATMALRAGDVVSAVRTIAGVPAEG